MRKKSVFKARSILGIEALRAYQAYCDKQGLTDKVAFISNYTAPGDVEEFRSYVGFNVYPHISSLLTVDNILTGYPNNSINLLVVGGHAYTRQTPGQPDDHFPGVVFDKKKMSRRLDSATSTIDETRDAGFSPQEGDIGSDNHPLVTLIKNKVKSDGIIVVASCWSGYDDTRLIMKAFAKRLGRTVVGSVIKCAKGLKAYGTWIAFHSDGNTITYDYNLPVPEKNLDA